MRMFARVRSGGDICWFDLSRQQRRWLSFLKVLKDEEIVLFQLCMMSTDGFCFHLTTFSGFRDQTPAGSDAEHQKCNNHFASIITVELQVQLELMSPTSY